MAYWLERRRNDGSGYSKPVTKAEGLHQLESYKQFCTAENRPMDGTLTLINVNERTGMATIVEEY